MHSINLFEESGTKCNQCLAEKVSACYGDGESTVEYLAALVWAEGRTGRAHTSTIPVFFWAAVFIAAMLVRQQVCC